MQFHYIASQQDGRIIENDIDASNTEEVLAFISSRGWKPVSIKPIRRKERGLGIKSQVFSGRITNMDKIFISRYLGLMLKIGTGLLQAINILIEDFDKPTVKSFLLEVRSSLEKGAPFYTAFAKYPKTFSQVYINSIKAGEESGNLETIFDNLTTSLTKEKLMHDQIRSALFYPAILLTSSVLILIFLVMFALPKIANVFSQSGFEPPLFSKIVFSVGLFLGGFGWYIILALIFSGIGFFVLFRTSLVFKRFLQSIFFGLPLIKNVVKKIALQRFAATLSSLIKAGIPITDALEITSDSVAQVELKDALIRISREGLAKGLTIGESFKREPFFPKTVVNLISISEKAGHIEDVLATLGDFYVSEIDSSLKTLVSFLEPLLLVGIGLIVGFIALAIIVPIYQLTIQF